LVFDACAPAGNVHAVAAAAMFTHLELAVENQNQPAVQTPGPAKGRVSVARILIVLVIGVALGLFIYFGLPYFLIQPEQKPSYPRLQMGGTSTVFVIAENRWKGDYRKAKQVDISYDSTGSTTGASHLIDGTYTVAFTHGPLSAEQVQKAKEKGGDVVQVPVLLCGVAVVYNVKELKPKKELPAQTDSKGEKEPKDKKESKEEVKPLKLTGEVLADIFLGKITQWDDPALKTLNPELPLPATKITVVHRKDSSGTTQLFTEYLDAVSKAWRDKVGPPASEVKWPVGEAAPRNLGVAQLVDKTEGAIGYVDRMFTEYEEIKLDSAAIENKDKTGFVRAEPENMTAAAASIVADLPDDLGFNLANKPGKDAYPISGVIYATCYQKQPEETRKRLVEFLRWATHEGQPSAAKIEEQLRKAREKGAIAIPSPEAAAAPLPPELVKRTDQRVEAIKAKP
jgi:phosphate transport system substrate-binding protein